MSLVNCAVVLISLVCLIPAVLCYDDNFDDLVSVTEHAPTSWSKHGEPCYEDNGQLCDIKESLACVNNTCLCKDPEEMTYDTSIGLCVGRAGHPCVRHPNEKKVSYNKRNQCTSFASCETEGKNETCKCWSSFYQDELGHCVRRREYLQKCDRDEHCSSRKGFVCLQDLGVCGCDSNSTSYNPDTERCVGLPNQECTNAYRECTEHHKCKAGVCRCKFKEVERDNGTITCDPVRHKFGKPCGRFRGECGDETLNLRCLDGKCRCKNPDYQTYDYERRMCVSRVGGPCTIPNNQTEPFRSGNGTYNSKFNVLEFPSTQCIPYAECVPHQYSLWKSNGHTEVKNVTFASPTPNRGICECSKTFVESKKGMCHLPYGSPCDTTSKNKKDECASPLKCVNNLCACPNEVDLYDDASKQCFKSVGSICTKDSSCVKNAECKKRKKGKDIPGRCRCMPKFKVTLQGTCY